MPADAVKSFFYLLGIAISLVFLPATSVAQRPRLLVLTDIGGDPDDTQSLIRLLVYANEFEIEGLVASASGTRGELNESVTRTDLIRQVIDAYGQVVPNLKRHADGFPEPDDLVKCVKSGNPLRERQHIGQGQDTEGSRWIIEKVDSGSPARPLNISIWGGQTDLAQSLWRVKNDRGDNGLTEFVSKLRVYDIADQDGIADWMRAEFPGMHYILSKAPPGSDKRLASFRGMYLTGDESLTGKQWISENVLSRGPLGSLYPTKTWTAPNPNGCMKEGDTPSWFFFLPLGGNTPEDPTNPGWGGQFVKQSDGWYIDVSGDVDPRSTVSRWRAEFQADFALRMSWCLESNTQ